MLFRYCKSIFCCEVYFICLTLCSNMKYVKSMICWTICYFCIYFFQQQTPMHIACKKYSEAYEREGLKSLNVIIHLIRANADITSKDEVSVIKGMPQWVTLGNSSVFTSRELQKIIYYVILPSPILS